MSDMIIHYNFKLKERSRELRKNATFCERLLWKYLRAGQIKGYRFLRQKPIDEYIVDFYCKRLKLIIEIDGISHIDKQDYDKRRENKLKELGFTILRFDWFYVLKNINGVLELIIDNIEDLEQKYIPPSPFQRGG